MYPDRSFWLANSETPASTCALLSARDGKYCEIKKLTRKTVPSSNHIGYVKFALFKSVSVMETVYPCRWKRKSVRVTFHSWRDRIWVWPNFRHLWPGALCEVPWNKRGLAIVPLRPRHLISKSPTHNLTDQHVFPATVFVTAITFSRRGITT